MSNPAVDFAISLIHDFDARVQATPAAAWHNDSPCAGWTARDVVVHVGDSLLRVAQSLDGGPARTIGFDEDITTAWNDAVARFTAIVTVADLDQVIPNLFGPFTVAVVIGQFMTTDVLVHTWDLARAVGGDEQLNPVAVTIVHDSLKPLDETLRAPGVFGPKIDADDGADAQTQLITFLGRKV